MSHTTPYRLDGQIGFIPRQANQRYAALFTNGISNGLTPTQWTALTRFGETGPCPQNQLDRFIAMGVTAIKGVVGRLDKRGLAQRSVGLDDDQRLLADLDPAGCAEPEAGLAVAREISRQALVPLSLQGQGTLRELLTRLV